MVTKQVVECSLCRHPAHLVSEFLPGYKEDQRYSIYECENCLSSFAFPLASDDTIYCKIYDSITTMPGYNRYLRYAHEVLKQKKPLDYLARQEESYWAVAQHLRKRRTSEDSLNILELGCGMGYFTYALAKEGFTATGVDISSQAIAWALEHYGPYYACKTLQELGEAGNRYDLIIMNQLVEHLPDVHALLAAAIGLLSPVGELIITTPNKSAYPGADWETDLPPVHLWWFGEAAMRHLAELHGCSIAFVDFEPFYSISYRIKPPNTPLSRRQSIFNAQGTLLVSQKLPPVTPLRRMLEHTGVLEFLRRIRLAVAGKVRWSGTRGPICAVVLRR